MRDLEFDIRGRDRSKDAFDSAERNARRFNGVLDQTQRMLNLGAIGAKAFAAGFALGGIEELGRAMLSAVKSAADLADLSKKIGIPTDDIQRLNFGLAQAGVEAADVDNILTQWAKRIGEAHTKGGQLADVLRANGVAMTDGNGKLRSSVELMTAYAELIRNAGSDQERLVLATLAFGNSGDAMAAALAGGASGLREMLAAAGETGTALDRELVERAEQIDERFQEIGRTIQTKIDAALIHVASNLLGIIVLAERLAGAMQDPIGVVPGAIPYDYEAIKNLTDQKLAIQEALRLNEQLAESDRAAGLAMDKELAAEIDQQKRQIAELEARIAGVAQTPKVDIWGDGDTISERARQRAWGGATDRKTVIPADGEKNRIDPWANMREVDRERLAVAELVTQLENELSLVRSTPQQKRAAEASRRAGAAATADERQRVIELTEALYLERRAEREAREDLEFHRDTFRGFIADLKNGDGGFWDRFAAAAERAFGRISDRWLDTVADMLFGTGRYSEGGSGSAVGIFERLFSGDGPAKALAGDGAAVAGLEDIIRMPLAPVKSAGMTGDNSVAGRMWNFFSGKGLKDFQVAAILGHGKAESAFNPMAVGDGGNAFGLFQWNDRRHELFDFIGGKGNLGDVDKQLQFAWHELQTSESGAFKRLLGSGNLRDATAAFGGFERAQGWSLDNPTGIHNWSGRLDAAEAALAKFSGATDAATANLGGLDKTLTSAVKGLADVDWFGSSDMWKQLASPNFQANTSLSAILGYGGGSGSAGGGGGWLSSLFTGLFSLFGFADGGRPAGRVHGPGGSRDDGMLAWFSAGEYIVNAPSASRYGNVLDAINSGAPASVIAHAMMAEIPGFADGGWPGDRAFRTRAARHDYGVQSSGLSGLRVNGEIGVVVEDEGRLQGYVRRMGFEAAEAGSAMAVETTKRSLPGWQDQFRNFGRID